MQSAFLTDTFGSGIIRTNIPAMLEHPGTRSKHTGDASMFNILSQKLCAVCGEVKPISEFPKKSGKCKPCQKEYQHAWYVENADAVKGRVSKWNESHPDKVYLYNKRWAKKNTDNVRERSAKHRNENRDEYVDYMRDWHARNAGHEEEYRKETSLQSNVRTRNRRAKMNNQGEGWTPEEERNLIASYGGRCAYCNKKTDRLEMEHVIPLSRGGEHSINNVVPACRSCNASKHNTPLLVFLLFRRFFK